MVNRPKINVTAKMLQAKIGELQSSATDLRGADLVRAYQNISVIAQKPHRDDIHSLLSLSESKDYKRDILFAGPVPVKKGRSGIFAQTPGDLGYLTNPAGVTLNVGFPPNQPMLAELTCPHCKEKIKVTLS